MEQLSHTAEKDVLHPVKPIEGKTKVSELPTIVEEKGNENVGGRKEKREKGVLDNQN